MPKTTTPQPYAKPDQIQIRGNQIYSPVRKTWVQLTLEERVRQEFLFVLINEYGYSLDQVDEETPVTGRGSAQARADFLIWRTPEAKKRQEHALIVINREQVANGVRSLKKTIRHPPHAMIYFIRSNRFLRVWGRIFICHEIYFQV
jgi:hypothetical protein